jgi:hypothetical protein
MAAYQGARRRSGIALRVERGPGLRDAALDLVPRGRAASRSLARAAARPGVRGARSSWVGVGLVTIVVVFAGAFLSLSQSVRVAATSYDIVRLASEQERLEAIRADLRSDVERLRSDPAIRKQALDAGLGQLAAPIVLPAR